MYIILVARGYDGGNNLLLHILGVHLPSPANVHSTAKYYCAARQLISRAFSPSFAGPVNEVLELCKEVPPYMVYKHLLTPH
jgi:hypothetical protein